jgi:two-component system, chemotaxis family, protein-glutamate methylesterase/glutaminase
MFLQKFQERYVMATAEFHVIAIGASAGALDAVRRITEALRNCEAAIIEISRRSHFQPSSRNPELAWKNARIGRRNGAALEPGRIYVAPPDHHVLLERPGRNSVGSRIKGPQHPAGC